MVARRYQGKTYKKPKRPIGKGRPGTAKRKIYRTGGGKAVLATYRQAGKQKRTSIRKRSRTNQRGLTGAIMNVRRNRMKRGVNATTGKAKGPPSSVQPKPPGQQVVSAPRPLRLASTKGRMGR